MPSIAVSRRALLAGMGALAAAPSFAARPSSPEAVIIGAGAAGIGASHTLKALGISHIIVEADNRIGGRAYTDTTTFGMPFDVGCAWLHAADRNPYYAYALEHGYRVMPHNLHLNRLFYGPTDAGEAGVEAEHKAEDVIHKNVERIAKTEDVPVTQAVPEWTPPYAAAATYMGPMDMGVDFAQLSTVDYADSAELDPNYLVYEGYGTLMKQQAGALPVRLGVSVKRIDSTRGGVAVVTSHGTIQARAAIVTVSTGVLGAGVIASNTLLPQWKKDAIADVPMGLLAKIPMLIEGDRFGVEPFQNVLDERPNGESMYFLAWPFQSNLMVGFVGGNFGRTMSGWDDAKIFDFAKARLNEMFGTSAGSKVKKAMFTRWQTNPLTLGAYAAAKPGRFEARAALARPVDQRLFFAGEALAPDGLIQTCAGAYQSGIATARELAASVAPVRRAHRA